MTTAVVAWGRMNPPTEGHQQLFKRVFEVAKKNNGKPLVYVTQTQDKKKNPLSYQQKIKYIKSGMPNKMGKAVQEDPSIKNIIQLAQLLDDTYDHIILVAGSDRMDEFSKLLNRYNGKEFSFDSIDVVSAGSRDPDAEGVKGMSASKMRELAKEGDYDAFAKGAPSGLNDKQTQQLYKDVRDGLMIKEGIFEAEMTDELERKREEYVKALKKREDGFKERYGDRWKSVMYATATKMAKDDLGINEGAPSTLQLLMGEQDDSEDSENGKNGKKKKNGKNDKKQKSQVIINPDSSDDDYQKASLDNT